MIEKYLMLLKVWKEILAPGTSQIRNVLICLDFPCPEDDVEESVCLNNSNYTYNSNPNNIWITAAITMHIAQLQQQVADLEQLWKLEGSGKHFPSC